MLNSIWYSCIVLSLPNFAERSILDQDVINSTVPPIYISTLIQVKVIVFINIFFSLIAYYELYVDLDPHISCPEPSNPWIADNTEFWELETCM